MIKLKNSKFRCSKYRKKILEISQTVSALHVGGSFSSVEIVDCIYNLLLKKNDTFILSKGHAGILQYVVLNDLGIIKDSDLRGYSSKNGFLGVHPDYGVKGIEASTGSLGHGLAIAAGMSFSNYKKNQIYILLSDGELQEGSVWESALIISSLSLNNIVLIIDNNDFQSSTRTQDTHPTLYPIEEKFSSFGWEVGSCSGHNSKKILEKISKRSKRKPFALVAKTIKGFPVSFMKNNPIWHYRSPNKDEFLLALKEI